MIFDEVQTGVGRTGRFYAYEHCGIHPDILTSAKGIGAGFPMSACLATADAARGLTVGVHGTTFGGNPLAMAVGNATLDVILAPGFLERVARLGLDMRQRLAELKDRHDGVIEEVRGEGLMIGLKLKVASGHFRRRRAGAEASPHSRRRQCRARPAAARGHRRGDGRRRAAARRGLRSGQRAPGGGDQLKRAMNAPVHAQPRHFLDLLELSSGELRGILDAAAAMKAARVKGAEAASRPLAGKTLAMIFDRPSTRTRVSFDVGMRELGGESIMLTGAEMQLGRGETIADTARVLSRYVDAIVIRILAHDDMQEMAAHATVPVINALTKQSHPCQVLADVMTFEEKRGPIRGRKIAWSGDYNNVLSSWIDASARFDFRLEIACPPELQPGKQRLEAARKAGANIAIGVDPVAAARDAAAVISDCWVSMGDEDEGRRHNLLAPYQVNAKLMSHAAADAIFMHCLPAHRGEEVTDEVIDGPQSVVFDEAENRLHAQKGVLAWCLGAAP